MVAAVVRFGAGIVAVHRTFLTPEARKVATSPKTRRWRTASNPTNPASRFQEYASFDEITKGTPEKALTKGKKRSGGKKKASLVSRAAAFVGKAVRAALGATIGAPVDVSVVVGGKDHRCAG